MSYSEEEELGNSLSVDNAPNKDKIAACIRQTGNWSKIKGYHLFDRKAFMKKTIINDIEESSPKLLALIDKIAELDKSDMKKTGKVYKHMIFTDVSNSSYSSKIIASALIAFEFTPAFESTKTSLKLKDHEDLIRTKNNNFGMLMSKPVFNQKMNTKFKQSMMNLYNTRPDNIHGELMRFIILDQGFKEGIDLFDVKYVHLFEPLVVKADEKQAIGRSTRLCGQKGLEFHPKFGWPLYVFRYEIGFPESLHKKLDAKQLFELYLKYSTIDLRRVVFASDIEEVLHNSAVDKMLTASIHKFKIDSPPPILDEIHLEEIPKIGGAVTRQQTVVPLPPKAIMNQNNMQIFVQSKYAKFTYPKIKLDNDCNNKLNKDEFMFTQTQNFIRHFFQPESAYKGMLLWHSVGTGKTCTAIADASTSFEKEGYTILWVTRHTLKSDIWKNMFGRQSCSVTFKDTKMPAKITKPFKYMPSNWMEPISYKTFSNMLLQKNVVYNDIINRNGADDPLRKTLLIIDEAHKLYSPGVSASEKPDTDILEEMIQNSYKKSGKDSVRVLLMTATPYTEDAMEFVQLLNLLRPQNKFPSIFDSFSKKYLDRTGHFTTSGRKRFIDETSGYISYLNRSQDARNFAHPVFKDVIVPISTMTPEPSVEDKRLMRVNKFTTNIKDLKVKKRELKTELRKEVKDFEVDFKTKCKDEKTAFLNKCKTDAVKDSKELLSKLANKKIELKNKKKTDEHKCMELKPAQRKHCKESIKELFDKEILMIKNLNGQNKENLKNNTKDCSAKAKEYSNDCKTKIQTGKSNILEGCNKINYEIDEVQTNYKKIRESKKQQSVLIEDIRTKKKLLSIEINKLIIRISSIKQKYKSIKQLTSNDKNEIKELRIKMKPLVLKKKELRDLIIKHTKTKDFIADEIVTKYKKDKSQERALYEVCKIDPAK